MSRRRNLFADPILLLSLVVVAAGVQECEEPNRFLTVESPLPEQSWPFGHSVAVTLTHHWDCALASEFSAEEMMVTITWWPSVQISGGSMFKRRYTVPFMQNQTAERFFSSNSGMFNIWYTVQIELTDQAGHLMQEAKVRTFVEGGQNRLEVIYPKADEEIHEFSLNYAYIDSGESIAFVKFGELSHAINFRGYLQSALWHVDCRCAYGQCIFVSVSTVCTQCTVRGV